MDGSDFFDFNVVPWHLKRRFMELLPDSELIKFKSVNKLSFSIFLHLLKVSEINEKLEIVVDWFSSEQTTGDDSKKSDKSTNGFLITTKTLSIVCSDFTSISRKPSLSDEIIFVMFFTALSLEELELENVELSKNDLLLMLQRCQKLTKLTVKNCLINEKIDIGKELLPQIPNCRSLILEATPEFSTNKNTAELFEQHVGINGKFTDLRICPYYCPQNFEELVKFEQVSDSPVQLSIFVTSFKSFFVSDSIDLEIVISVDIAFHFVFIVFFFLQIMIEIIKKFCFCGKESSGFVPSWKILVDNGTPLIVSLLYHFVFIAVRFSLNFLVLDGIYCFFYRLLVFSRRYPDIIEVIAGLTCVCSMFLLNFIMDPIFRILISEMQLFNALLLTIVVELYVILAGYLYLFLYVRFYVR